MSVNLTGMSVFVFGSGEKVDMEPHVHEWMEKLPARGELLVKKKEFLKKKIDHLEFFAKKNSRKNRRAALQVLRRKKCYEKHIKYIDCAVKAMRVINEHIEIVNKVSDLMKDIAEEEKDETGDMPESLCTPMDFEGEFNEGELMAELEKLEKNVDESLLEVDVAEDGDLCPKVMTTALPSHRGFCREIITKVNDLIKDIIEEQDVTEDFLDSLYTAVRFEVEFNEDELLEELEKLEKNLDESLNDADGEEDGVLCPKVLTTASHSYRVNTDEENIEDDLEYLQRWANASRELTISYDS